MNNKQQTMGRGFAVLSISNILVKVLSLFFVPVLRLLLGGSSAYGVYSVSNTVFAFVYVLATAGLPVAIAKLVSELVSQKDEKGAEKAFRLARAVMFSMGTVLTILMAVLSKPIARMMNAEDAWGGILFIAPTIMICSLLSAYKGYFQGRKNMNPTAISQVMEQFVHMIVSFTMVWLMAPKGIVWAVAGASMGTVAGALVSLVFMVYQRKKFINSSDGKNVAIVRQQGDGLEKVLEAKAELPEIKLTTKKLLKRIFYYSLPITLNTAITYAGDMIDASVLIGRLQVAGFSEKVSQGLYGDLAATRQLLNVPTSIISAMCVSILPTMAALHALKEHDKKSLKANEGYKLCYLIAVPMTAGFAVFAQAVFTLLGYGENYNLLMALSFSVILQGTVHLQSSILQSVNRLFTSTMFLLSGALIKLILSYVLAGIPSLNIYGAVISTYGSFIVPFALNQWVLNKKEKMGISVLGNLWKPCLASVFMVMVGFPMYEGISFILPQESYFSVLISFAITVVVCVAVYVYVLMKIGGLTKEDVNEISPVLAKKWPKKLRRIF
ncbi:MAG: polysaccharide biosynthesis protein [Ruminococcaceae bacterium]|nr:polysaccharide biosynthesis protein [Oscillospiraceae bacterium]